eukprot:9178735-Pyramimonas_sp.AAC.1
MGAYSGMLEQPSASHMMRKAHVFRQGCTCDTEDACGWCANVASPASALAESVASAQGDV